MISQLIDPPQVLGLIPHRVDRVVRAECSVNELLTERSDGDRVEEGCCGRGCAAGLPYRGGIEKVRVVAAWRAVVCQADSVAGLFAGGADEAKLQKLVKIVRRSKIKVIWNRLYTLQEESRSLRSASSSRPRLTRMVLTARSSSLLSNRPWSLPLTVTR
jgi:hypothetical protein